MTACEWFVDGLQKAGVEWMATLCGHGLDPLYHAASRAGMRLVDTRNEQTAAYIADAWSRLTGWPGICAVSSGVAHANALTGVLNAHFDGSPMVLVSGAGALRTAGLGHFQDCDQAAMARPITKYSRVIDCADRVLEILNTAMETAIAPPAGPVHLTFPMDVQTTTVDAPIARSRIAVAMVQEDVDAVAGAVEISERPLIVAGSGVFYSRAGAELVEFSERFSIPVVVPIWDRGVIERPVATFMGVIGAASGGPRLLPDADLVIMAGATADYRLGFLEAAPRVERFERGWRPLADRLRQARTSHVRWLEEAQRRRDEFRLAVRRTGERQAVQGTHAIHILDAIGAVRDDKTLLLIDGGSIGQWAHQLLCDRYPLRWLTCGRSGVVGWGLGGAMAARLAFPGDPVILLSGDGAFTFNVAEIECAVRQKLHFVAIVADDLGWGITRTGHVRQFGEPIASSLGPVAFDGLAESLGARGVVARRPEEIRPAIEDALSRSAVTVIHVPVVGGSPAA